MDEQQRQLAEDHTHLIRKVVNQIGRRLPSYIQREDLLGVAAIGLMDAATKFDAERGSRFSSYAEFRIRGAILDELRQLDPMPRMLRSRAKKMEKTISSLTIDFGRKPEDDEVANAMGLKLNKYHEMLLLIEQSSTISYVEEIPQGQEGQVKTESASFAVSTSGVLGDEGSRRMKSPLSSILQQEEIHLLAEAVSKMDARDQLVLSLHYQEEYNFRQIAEILGLTESRVSQLHKGAVVVLRDRITRMVSENEGE
jgi:RNA polymerase sigma factor for flagellar operon FliA